MTTEEQALQLARARAAEKGWAFVEPARVVQRKSWRGQVTRYEIETNSQSLGPKARFVVDARSGLIVSEGYVPR